MQLDENQIKSYALAEIEKLLLSHGKDMKEHYPTMPRSDVSMNNDGLNRLIYEELRYDKDLLRGTCTFDGYNDYGTKKCIQQNHGSSRGKHAWFVFFVWIWWNG